MFRIIFIVIDFSLGIVYAVLTVTDAKTHHRLPSTDFYSVSKFEIAIRIGLAPDGPMQVSDRLTDSKNTVFTVQFKECK